MSDAIREAFEKWWLSRRSYRDSDKEAAYAGWQAALQSSQTAPAVPEEEVKAQALELLDQVVCQVGRAITSDLRENIDSLLRASQQEGSNQ